MGLEEQLWEEARAFLSAVTTEQKCSDPKKTNLPCLVLALTGEQLVFSAIGKRKALDAVEALLCRERKKSRLRRQDYNPNRHIALHQCKKRLEAEQFNASLPVK